MPKIIVKLPKGSPKPKRVRTTRWPTPNLIKKRKWLNA